MRLLFKQRFFSWFDSYDIYNENGEIIFEVQGKPSWGKKLEVYDASGKHIGTLQRKVFDFFPTFEIYLNDRFVGSIRKRFTFLKPSFDLDCNGWYIEGNFTEWDYAIIDPDGAEVASLSKEIFNFTDTYVLDIREPANAVAVLMIALAIDAEKASRN